MSNNRLAYQHPDGTVQRARLIGLAADRPAANTVPPYTPYFSTDIGVVEASDGVSTWFPIIRSIVPTTATDSVPGVVQMRTTPSGAHPTALTTDDLGAAGVVPLDSVGRIPEANLPIAGASTIGGVKAGTGVTVDGAGEASITPSGGGSFGIQHNGVLVAAQPIGDFEDGTNFSVTATDDPGNNKVTISPSMTALVSTTSVPLGVSSLTLTAGSWQNIISQNLGVGRWLAVALAYISFVSGGSFNAEFRLHDGSGEIAATAETCNIAGELVWHVFLVSDEIEVLSGTKTISFQAFIPTGVTARVRASTVDHASILATQVNFFKVGV